MLLQFAAGLGLGVAAERGRLPSRAMGAGLILAALLVWTLVQAGSLFSELWRPLLWGVPAVLLVGGALGVELGGRPLRLPGRWTTPVLVLGDASYCIYLFHLPATAVVAHTLGYANPWLFLPVSMAASILAGLAARAWVEKPLLARLRRPFRATSPRGASRTGST
jgi:exopolysaccharide production protein ExoZ